MEPLSFPGADILASLANEFLRATPGSASGSVPGNPGANAPAAPANPQPPGLIIPPGASGPATPAAVPFGGYPPASNVAPTVPQYVAPAVGRAPALAPHAQSQNGAPDTVRTALPPLEPRAAGLALAVPAESVPRASPPVPSFYFLDFASPAAPGASGEVPARADVPAVPVPSESPAAPQQAPAQYASARPPQFPEVPVAAAAGGHPAFDVLTVRRDFPILQETVNGRPLVWFDNAATTQKPRAVIDRLVHFYEHENSNIHRAAHELAARATDAYENARATVRRFLGAASNEEIVFVRGATEGINLIAKSWGAQHLRAGDEIVVSHLEHHANIVPWQQLAQEKGARLRVIPVDDSGQVLLDEYQRLLNDRTKIVSVTQISNALGTVVPVREIVQLAHRAGACALVDGAQSVSHMRVDVAALDADFFVFSGHKIFGPTGIGAVYGKRDLLEAMPPWQGGGNMIRDVTFERTSYQGAPARFEAGTGNIADAAGLAAALEYVERIGLENIARHEHDLLEYATGRLREIAGVRLIGTAADKASVLSFVVDGTTTEEVGKALNEEGIAVRAGHHCAQPILRRFGLESTVRASLAFYNTCEEVDRMASVVRALARRA